MSLFLRYLGHSAVLLKGSIGRRVLIDPWITENYASPVGMDEIGHIDLILVTHGAPDHMGDAIAIAEKTGATIMCGADVKIHAESNGILASQIQVMIWGAVREFEGLHIRCLESRHHSFFRSGTTYFSNIAMGYVINFPSGFSVYHMGDTSIFGDLKIFGELYHPSLVLVPIGMQRGMVTELDPVEAALAVSWLNPRMAIPIHYDPTTQADEPNKFLEELSRRNPTIRGIIVAPGETLDLTDACFERIP